MDAVELPRGEDRPPVVSSHFPDRVHELLWRNWGLVDPERLAGLLGASTAAVVGVAASMGLPPDPPASREMAERGYVTLIRRNWHLLPYAQLLELLGMTADRLDVVLREEDFLWVKLGRQKPRCPWLDFRPPDRAALERAAEIRGIVEEELGDALFRPAVPRFEFVRELGAPPPAAASDSAGRRAVPLRLVHSYVALYGDPLARPEPDPYPDGLLARLAAVGINGVWLQGLLRDLAPGGESFPEFGAGSDRRLENLRALVRRAAVHGVGVYLYINEPRAMPAAFFEGRPEMAGARENQLTALCTSHPAVLRWVADALCSVFREVPDLGGVYAITASENLTNCASRGGIESCPRCRSRTESDVVTEVIGAIEAGVHRAAPRARVLISDWGWQGHGDARDTIRRLPASVTLMSVSEWSLPIERGGVKSTVGEYAISAVGPGPRATAHWEAARAAGIAVGTEIQLNNTCELASLPYLPVMDLVAEHCRNLAPIGLDAMLIGWTMGGYPSPNFRLAWQIARDPAAGAAAALDAVARERFGVGGAPHARRAWTLMSEAFRQYPFHVGVVYNSPVQLGPANPVYAEPTGYRATMWGIPYDDLEGWRGPYPPEVFAAQFERMAAGWAEGVRELGEAVRHCPAELRPDAEADLRLARAAGINFLSVANQARFVMARDALAARAGGVPAASRLRDEISRSLRSEIALARELLSLVQRDSRIGFEPSCQYFYLPQDLAEKVVCCRWVLERLTGSRHAW